MLAILFFYTSVLGHDVVKAAEALELTVDHDSQVWSTRSRNLPYFRFKTMLDQSFKASCPHDAFIVFPVLIRSWTGQYNGHSQVPGLFYDVPEVSTTSGIHASGRLEGMKRKLKHLKAEDRYY